MLGLPTQSELSPARVQESRSAGATEPLHVRAKLLLVLSGPATQSCSPGRQGPVLPTGGASQSRVLPITQAQVLSMTLSSVPSQLPSMLAVQRRGTGSTEPVHSPKVLVVVSAPATQTRVPARQIPTLSMLGCAPHTSDVPTAQVQLVSRVLSGEPSQLLSTAEAQLRSAGKTAPTQPTNSLLTQVLVPFLQMPSSFGGPQGACSPSTQAQPVLGRPLQSASSPRTRQLSVPGPTPPTQAPQSLLSPSGPAAQVREPARHSPTPSSPGCVLQGSVLAGTHLQTSSTLSSGWPSQSLSSLDVQRRFWRDTAPMQSPQAPLRHTRVPTLQFPASVLGPHARVIPVVQPEGSTSSSSSSSGGV